MVFRGLRWLALGALCAGGQAIAAPDLATLAQKFGQREAVRAMRLSPSGDQVAYLAPAPGGRSQAMVADLRTGAVNAVIGDIGTAGRLRHCDWKGETRLICRYQGVLSQIEGNRLVGVTRIIAVDRDGTHALLLGQKDNGKLLGLNQSSGDVIDMLPDDPANVLMQIYQIPEESIGTLIARTGQGLAAERVDVRTSVRHQTESPRLNGLRLVTDGRGRVRVAAVGDADPDGVMRSTLQWFARPRTGGWQPLMNTSMTATQRSWAEGLDDSGDGLFVFRPQNGRLALFRRDLVSGEESLVFAHPKVDAQDVLRVGKYARPVAVEYTTDKDQLHYLDPAYAKLSAALAKALPGGLEVTVLDEDWTGARKLVFAGSDTDPGRYYRYDGATRQLAPILPVHPALDGMALGVMTAITYPARDGTPIPGYLTLPPGVTSPRGLPALVLPHGGPSARDTWGFDWLSQFYAQAGYAVLQPNFRGSAGYGEAWFRENGFKAWRTAIGDVNDGARWLLAQGADPKRLGAVGWSYGGYAVLQAAATEPTLYKAVVAIAPVTDLQALKDDAQRSAARALIRDYIGSGAHVVEGSPARQAGRISAPVLIFQGTKDLNVSPDQARIMDSALARAGKPHRLVIYEGLAHDLGDSAARADMLKQSGEFLAAMK